MPEVLQAALTVSAVTLGAASCCYGAQEVLGYYDKVPQCLQLN